MRSIFKMKKITKADVKAFFTLDRKDVVQLAVMAAVVCMNSDLCSASSVETKTLTDADTGATISTISTPLKTIEGFMSGTVGKSIATIGAVVFGASWAANIENQVTKSAMRIAGGGAIAVGGSSIIADVTAGGTSGFLF